MAWGELWALLCETVHGYFILCILYVCLPLMAIVCKQKFTGILNQHVLKLTGCGVSLSR